MVRWVKVWRTISGQVRFWSSSSKVESGESGVFGAARSVMGMYPGRVVLRVRCGVLARSF